MILSFFRFPYHQYNPGHSITSTFIARKTNNRILNQAESIKSTSTNQHVHQTIFMYKDHPPWHQHQNSMKAHNELRQHTSSIKQSILSTSTINSIFSELITQIFSYILLSAINYCLSARNSKLDLPPFSVILCKKKKCYTLQKGSTRLIKAKPLLQPFGRLEMCLYSK